MNFSKYKTTLYNLHASQVSNVYYIPIENFTPAKIIYEIILLYLHIQPKWKMSSQIASVELR